MSYQCPRCNKQCRDNYDLKRHQARKTPCVVQQQTVQDTSNVNININITNNQQNNITNYNVLPDPQSIPRRVVERAIDMFDEEQPMYTTAKSVIYIRGLLNKNPENRNTNVDPKSAMAMVYNNGRWERRTKREAIDNSIRQTARTLSDAADIVGVDTPEDMTECLETIAVEQLADLGLSPTQLSNIVNMITTVLTK